MTYQYRKNKPSEESVQIIKDRFRRVFLKSSRLKQNFSSRLETQTESMEEIQFQTGDKHRRAAAVDANKPPQIKTGILKVGTTSTLS